MAWGLLVAGSLAVETPARAQPAEVFVDGELRPYTFLDTARRPWRLCVLLPHGKDKYWWGVSWGADEQAKRLGVQIGIYQAGGYEYLETQRQQWLECRKQRADAYVLGAIQASALRAEINEALAEGKPVIDLINGVEGRVSSRSLVSFAEMAAAAAQHALSLPRAPGAQPLRLAWFPGPAGARWVQDGSAGLLGALHDKPVRILDGGNGPTDAKSQASLVRAAIERHGRFDLLLGNAVAVEFAARWFKGKPDAPKLVAYYATEEVIKHVRDGQVSGAPTDQPVLQARIAVDLAVRALQGEKLPERVSPRIVLLDAKALKTFDLTKVLPPPGQWMVQRELPR